jgi:uncharacterized protein GlcG (DUF336 family)
MTGEIMMGEKKQFEDGIQLMHFNYLLAFDGIIASQGGIPVIDQGVIIGAIGCSGSADSQDEIVSNAGAAVIHQLERDSGHRIRIEHRIERSHQ